MLRTGYPSAAGQKQKNEASLRSGGEEKDGTALASRWDAVTGGRDPRCERRLGKKAEKRQRLEADLSTHVSKISCR